MKALIWPPLKKPSAGPCADYWLTSPRCITNTPHSLQHRRDLVAHANNYVADKLGFSTALIGLCLIAAHSGTPSPIFPLYSEQWGLSSLEVSSVFAVYICGLLVTLLTCGALSDHIGRRPVAFSALLIAAASMLVMAFADSLNALLIARILQGIASGLGFGTLGAALLDYSPASRHRTVAMLNGAVPPAAIGLGALLSGILVQFAPYPFQIPYLAVAALLILALIPASLLKERHPRRHGVLRSLIPSVMIPKEVRREFLVAVGALLASWALVGMYLGLGASITKTLMNIQAPTLSGLAIFALTGASAVLGAVTFQFNALKVMALGCISLIVGSGGLVLAVYTENTAIYFISSIIGGIGLGGAFQGGLRTIVEHVPALQRGGTLSSVYLVSYLAFGLPTLIGGLLIPIHGLKNITYGYAGLVVLLSVIALALLAGTSRKGKPAATSQ
ncbi:MFS transporter [Arthrobacter sp. MYb211]|nr:MFS transporter [Arthrobacter sp. MYb221]PRC08242.1 MFS transporter [Arthrobacter sp. MYb211]